MREINKLNKAEDPEHLKPWQQYQLVKASWPAIVDSKTFAAVQDILEENAKVERRRLEDAHARIFLLSGILRCGECGRPLCGQSAHGRMSTHRYYGHADKRNTNSTCSLARLRADEIEEAVLNHFTEVAFRADYFKRLEKKLATFVEGTPEANNSQEAALLARLKAIEKEIASAFRMQTHLDSESGAFEMTAEHLEMLALEKKNLRARLQAIADAERDQLNPAETAAKIQQLISEVRRGFAKAPPPMKRRLLRKLLRGLVYTSEGLEVSFNVGPQYALDSNVVNLAAKRSVKTAPKGKNSDLSLSFRDLPISGNGCLNLITGNRPPVHDFIEFFQKKSPRIFDKIAPLYEKGLSISDISDQTGLKRTTIWTALKKHKKTLRSQNSVPFGRWRKGHGKQRARPPYGFCYFQGEVIKSPTEYPTLLLIESLWKQGADITSIMKKLESKKLRSRTGKPWSYNVIKSVIRRFSDGTIKNILSTQNVTKTKRSKK